MMRWPTTAGSGQVGMDSLGYEYITNTNKLKKVTDAVSSGNYADDIDNQTDANNYVYDEIGNLIQDKAEGIDSIKWTVYGKIERIVKGSTKILYTYDAAGNRISKIKTVSGSTTKATYYVRDASGNVMSLYERDFGMTGAPFRQTELHLYGSSRLGIYNVSQNVLCAPDSTDLTTFARGNKFFELSNHLGNVLVTVSDKHKGIDSTSDGVIDYYVADIVTANDYYPFGMGMPGRNYDNGSEYRYGFNGKENDKDISEDGQDYGMRVYDARLGRFLSVDPLIYSYPYYTPYQFAGNMPTVAIDVDGLEQFVVVHYKDQKNQTYKTEIRTIKAGGEMVDQIVKKAVKGNPSGQKIAKSNVLVFEVYKEGTNNQITNPIRNTPANKFNSQEEKIYKTKNKLVNDEDNSYSYPGAKREEYSSESFFNNPSFYEARETYPTVIKGYSEFNIAGFKTGSSWVHGYVENGKVTYSNQLDDRLNAAKADDAVTSITITLDIYTTAKFDPQSIENVKKEYRKHAARVSGKDINKITVVGKMQSGNSAKSSVMISTN